MTWTLVWQLVILMIAASLSIGFLAVVIKAVLSMNHKEVGVDGKSQETRSGMD